MATEPHLRALIDPEAFAMEQARLGQVWTLVGYASDIPRENDWFRTTLGGRSVFIQRFAEGLRGFENRCAQRSYPLRTAERGHGPILCGFHHWRYDSEGIATVIPNCRDAFGTTPQALGKRLAAPEVACCGDMIFARFPGGADSLERFLGPAFEILWLLCADMRAALSILAEDHAICETLQANARQIAPDPIYGASEIRVAWFNEAYAKAMRATGPPP